jgi:hypothetical protein
MKTVEMKREVIKRVAAKMEVGVMKTAVTKTVETKREVIKRAATKMEVGVMKTAVAKKWEG